MIMYHFIPSSDISATEGGLVTRLNAPPADNDWVLVLDAPNCQVADILPLDSYCIEILLMLSCGMKLLLLVYVLKDKTFLLSEGGKSTK